MYFSTNHWIVLRYECADAYAQPVDGVEQNIKYFDTLFVGVCLENVHIPIELGDENCTAEQCVDRLEVPFVPLKV